MDQLYPVHLQPANQILGPWPQGTPLSADRITAFQEAIPTMIQLQIVLLLLLRRRRTPLSIQQWGNLRLRQQLRVLSLSLHSHQTRQLLPLSRNRGKSSLAFFSVDAKILSLGVYTESDSDIEQLEACLHLPPSTPTLWFRLPQSLLSTHNKELAAAS